MQTRKVPAPTGFVLTHFVVAADVEVTSRFYSDVLGGEIVFEAPLRARSSSDEGRDPARFR